MRPFSRMPRDVPKIVMREVFRGVRYPRPGEFIEVGRLFRLYDALTFFKQATKATVKKKRAELRVAPKMQKAKIREALAPILEEEAAADEGAKTIERAFYQQEPMPPLASRDVEPAYYGADDDEGEEIEIGVDYSSAGGWHPKQGMNSAVAFNARLYREGGKISVRDAREAMDVFASTGMLPGDISVRWVKWARPWWNSPRHGTETDLTAFADIMAYIGIRGFRLGIVKPDTL